MDLLYRLIRWIMNPQGSKVRRNVFVSAASVVVFITTYMLILPAITIESEPQCGVNEHEHTEECYVVTETEICGTVEYAGHIHDEYCYETEAYLICEMEEDEEHVHDEYCYETVTELICTEEESEGHTHSEECYASSKALMCSEQEHVHTEECHSTLGQEKEEEQAEETEEVIEKTPVEQEEAKPEEEQKDEPVQAGDPTADVETAADWEATLWTVQLTGDWDKDVLAVAASQLGYHESTVNYVLDGDGDHLGYSRYGAWYGSPYGHWCAMYVSWVLNYAEVDRSLFPLNANCQSWINTLSQPQYNYYFSRGARNPKEGNLIFFDWNHDGTADHIGFVYELTYDENNKITRIKSIEGNFNDEVCHRYYDPDDEDIKGFAVLPRNPNYDYPDENVPFELSVELDDGTVIAVSGMTDALPFDPAEVVLNAKRLEEEEAAELLEEAVNTYTDENGEEHTAEDLGLNNKKTVLFDISLWHEGEEFEPSDAITVVFKNIPDFTIDEHTDPVDDISVFHVDTENQVFEEIETVLDEDGNIQMETDHFSIYAVAATENPVQDGTNINLGNNFTTANVNGKTIVLGADITTGNTVEISANTTIDLNGHTITYTGTDALFKVSGGVLNIMDSAEQIYTETEVTDGEKYGNTASYSDPKVPLTFVSSNVTGASGEGPEKLFDGNRETKLYQNNIYGSVEVVFRADQPVTAGRYSLTSANDTASNSNRIPSGWILYGGSSNNGPWVQIDQRSNKGGMAADNFTDYSYEISEPGSYQYYRIVFTGNRQLQLSEISLFEENKGLEYYVTDPVVVNNATGETEDTLYKYVINKAGMIVGSANGGRAIEQTGGTVNLRGGYITNFVQAESNAYGGAISSTGGDLNISGSVIAGNQAKDCGGAIYKNGGTLNISDKAVISGNTCATSGNGDRNGSWESTLFGGGGIYGNNAEINQSGGYVTNNKFTGTNYFDGGGGIQVKGGELNISGNAKLTGNDSMTGGGAVKTCRGTATIIRMTGGFLSSNHAHAEGGAVSIDNNGIGYFAMAPGSSGYITNNSISEMQHWGGGGLFCSDGSQMFVETVLITENEADGYGGGVAGCSTGRIYITVEDGGAIYNNTASGEHLSGDSSAKSEDRTYAAKYETFTLNGYQDYFCALASVVDGGMLGGGTANWTGSADGVAITSTSRNDVLSATYIMGLNAHPSDADQRAAENAASLFINGNYSYTHGGGILANGYLLIGRPEDIVVPARIELIGTKALKDQEQNELDMENHIFTFEVTDENNEVVAIGTNAEEVKHEDGTVETVGGTSITFDRRLPFEDGGTKTFYIRELSNNNDDGILYDTAVYRMTVQTLKEDMNPDLVNADGDRIKRYRIYLDNVKIEKKNGEHGEYVTIYDQDPGDDEQHPVTLSISPGSTTFINHDMQTISYAVRKQWNGDHSNIDSITVNLMRNGQVFSTKTLNEANGWKYEGDDWKNLPTKDNEGNTYSYYVKENDVAGYLATYSYTTDTDTPTYTETSTQRFSAGTYWVPVQAGEALVAGTDYLIVSSDYSKALTISEALRDTRMDNNAFAAVTGVYQGSFTAGETTYDSWIAGDITNANSLWQIGTQNGRTVLKSKARDSWLANEYNIELKTTTGIPYSSAVRWSNGYLQMQSGFANTSNNNAYRYMVSGDNNQPNGAGNSTIVMSSEPKNAVHLYKKITTTSRTTATVVTTSIGQTTGNTTAVITNTDIRTIDFRLNIRKVAQTNTLKALKDAHFNLLDEVGGTLKFTLGADGYYFPDDNGTTDLLISNANGYIRIKNLKGGTYTLKEVQAPAGYGVAPDQEIRLDENTTNATLGITVEDPDQYYVLPESGGIGTTVFRVIGTQLITAAGILLWLKQRSKRRL